MKQKDLALIIVVVFVTAIVSYFVSSKLFASPKDRQQEVEVVQPISAEFSTPDPLYFNSKSINPTQNIRIGGEGNQQPF